MLFYHGTVFGTLFNVVVLNATLLHFFFSFHIRATTCINVWLCSSQGWTLEDAPRGTADERDGIQRRNAIALKCSCFTPKFWICFLRSNGSTKIYSLWRFHELSEICRQHFSYAVRPFVLVTCNWKLCGHNFFKKCCWGAWISLFVSCKTITICVTFMLLERCI